MKINSKETPTFLNDYLAYLRVVKGRSERTVIEYYQDIRLFLRYLLFEKGKLTAEDSDISIRDFPAEHLKNVSLKDVYDYLNYLADERENNSRSRARKASSLKGFFKYLSINTTLINENPIRDLEMPKIKKSLPKFLSLDDSIKMLDSVNSSHELRDYCILTLFLNCGMRLSELVGINKNDINYTERTIRLLGKGNKERIIYLNDACIAALNSYNASKDNSAITDPHALFISRNGKRISKRRVQQIIESILKNAELDGKGLSTHKLRHTAATLMYQHGHVDTRILKEILGHESIATTEIYTHVSSEQLEKAADSSPLNSVKKDTAKHKLK